MKLINNLSKLSKYGIAVSFLALEVFAFIAFSFGDSFLLFGILSLALLVIGVLFSIKEIRSEGFISFAYLLFPLFIYSLLIALGINSKAHVSVNDYSFNEIIFVPISLLSIAACGYVLSLNKTFKIKHFLIVIFGALTLLTFINLMANIVNFGAFYPVKYKNYFMYYGGKKSEIPVNELAYVLQGFKFIEVEMQYFLLFPLLTLTSSFILISLKYKENKKTYLTFVLYNFISVLTLVLVPTLLGLLGLFIIVFINLGIYLYNKYEKVRKPFKITLWSILGSICIVLLIMILNNQSFAGGISNIIANNSLLNKVFNTNGYVQIYNKNLTNILCSDRFMGFYLHDLSLLIKEEAHMTGSWIFDNFMFSGVIGSAAFVLFLFMGFKSFNKYKVQTTQESGFKGALIVFTIFYILYTSLFYNGEYGIFHSVYKPLYMSAPFILFVFVISYSYAKSKEVTINE